MNYDDVLGAAVVGLPRRRTALNCNPNAFEPLKYNFARPFSLKTPTRQRENQNFGTKIFQHTVRKYSTCLRTPCKA